MLTTGGWVGSGAGCNPGAAPTRAVSYSRRHARNAVERFEPRGWCLDLTGAACPEGEEHFLENGSSP